MFQDDFSIRMRSYPDSEALCYGMEHHSKWILTWAEEASGLKSNKSAQTWKKMSYLLTWVCEAIPDWISTFAFGVHSSLNSLNESLPVPYQNLLLLANLRRMCGLTLTSSTVCEDGRVCNDSWGRVQRDLAGLNLEKEKTICPKFIFVDLKTTDFILKGKIVYSGAILSDLDLGMYI